MNQKKSPAELHPAIGLAWCIAVLAAYYAFSAPYYAYKISVFGKFLAGLWL